MGRGWGGQESDVVREEAGEVQSMTGACPAGAGFEGGEAKSQEMWVLLGTKLDSRPMASKETGPQSLSSLRKEFSQQTEASEVCNAFIRS